MKRKKRFNTNNVKYLIPVVILLIGIIIFNYFNKDDYLSKYKADKSRDLVYSFYDKDEIHVPYINILDNDIDVINKNIYEKANSVLSDEKNSVSYFYNLSGSVLSLAVQYLEYGSNSYPTVSFDTFNINIEDKYIYQSYDVLTKFQITDEDVSNIIKSKFWEFYSDEINKGIFDDECNFDCFLYMRGVKDCNYLENVSYYINNGKLYALKPFDFYGSAFESEAKYFSFNDYFIQITE